MKGKYRGTNVFSSAPDIVSIPKFDTFLKRELSMKFAIKVFFPPLREARTTFWRHAGARKTQPINLKVGEIEKLRAMLP